MLALFAVKLVAVHLLARAAGEDVAKPTPVHARADAAPSLVVAIEAEVDGRPRVFAGAPKVDWGGGVRAAETTPPAGLAVAWSKLEPTGGAYDNERGGGFHWDDVGYAATPWPGGAADLARPADVSPTILPSHGNLGTMHFQVAVTLGAQSLATPGLDDRYRGALGDDVPRVSLRRDDTFLGYLTESFNEPYIWASDGNGLTHQTERNVGGDCADFICYGLRRAGHRLPYGSTFDVPRWGGGKPIARIATRAADGRFLDAAGNPIPVGPDGVQPGDLLLFHRHVGAFVEDRPPLGVLDANDVLIHTAWAPPDEQTLDASKQWTSPPFDVYRVK